MFSRAGTIVQCDQVTVSLRSKPDSIHWWNQQVCTTHHFQQINYSLLPENASPICFVLNQTLLSLTKFILKKIHVYNTNRYSMKCISIVYLFGITDIDIYSYKLGQTKKGLRTKRIRHIFCNSGSMLPFLAICFLQNKLLIRNSCLFAISCYFKCDKQVMEV